MGADPTSRRASIVRRRVPVDPNGGNAIDHLEMVRLRSPGVQQLETGPDPVRTGWTLLTNHAHVLVAISRDPELRQREIARLVGITEGAVQRILYELEADGYVRRDRVGRRNRYHVDTARPLRHRLEHPHTVGDVLRSVAALTESDDP